MSVKWSKWAAEVQREEGARDPREGRGQWEGRGRGGRGQLAATAGVRGAGALLTARGAGEGATRGKENS